MIKSSALEHTRYDAGGTSLPDVVHDSLLDFIEVMISSRFFLFECVARVALVALLSPHSGKHD